MTATKNYYETLGVSREDSKEKIRSAYRKLAKRYHPDLNPGDKEAAERFKECSEAYGVIGDNEKRKIYDQCGFYTPAAAPDSVVPSMYVDPSEYEFYRMLRRENQLDVQNVADIKEHWAKKFPNVREKIEDAIRIAKKNEREVLFNFNMAGSTQQPIDLTHLDLRYSRALFGDYKFGDGHGPKLNDHPKACKFHHVDFSGSKMSSAQVVYSEFNDVNFTDALLNHAVIKDYSTFNRCRFDGVAAEKVRMEGVRFKNSSFDFSSTTGNPPQMNDASLTNVVFENIDLSNLVARNMKMSYVRFKNVTIRPDTFKGASMDDDVRFENMKVYDPKTNKVYKMESFDMDTGIATPDYDKEVKVFRDTTNQKMGKIASLAALVPFEKGRSRS